MIKASQCAFCARFQRTSADDTRRGVCDAFPDGIPREVMWGSHDHRLPYPGDNDVRFLAKDSQTDKFQWYMFHNRFNPEELYPGDSAEEMPGGDVASGLSDEWREKIRRGLAMWVEQP